MFNLDMVKGVLLAIGRPELTIYRNEKKNIGYEIRIRVNVRADSERFLEESKNFFQYRFYVYYIDIFQKLSISQQNIDIFLKYIDILCKISIFF